MERIANMHAHVHVSSCSRPTRIPFSGPKEPRGRRTSVVRSHSQEAEQAQPGNKGVWPTRRDIIHLAAATAAAPLLPSPVFAAEIEGPAGEAKQQLLELCRAKKGDKDVLPAFRRLAEFNPTSAPARSDKLYGKWRLVWASDNAEVSTATRKLPIPATSVQLLGEAGGEGAGRAANLINIAGGALVVKLSSAAILDESSDDTLLIQAPFYLELKLAGFTIPIQDTQPGKGAKNILGNEVNYFRQLYLEDSGRPGDLRLSEVTAGNDRVTGSLFVHERMA